MPNHLRLLPPLRHTEVVVIRRRKPLAERVKQEGLATLRDAADWQELSEMLWGKGDRRLVPDDKPQRMGNVIPLPLPGRRSTSQEIREVMREDIARGKNVTK